MLLLQSVSTSIPTFFRTTVQLRVAFPVARLLGNVRNEKTSLRILNGSSGGSRNQDQSKIYYFEDTEPWETDFKHLKLHYLIYSYISNNSVRRKCCLTFCLIGCAHTLVKTLIHAIEASFQILYIITGDKII